VQIERSPRFGDSLQIASVASTSTGYRSKSREFHVPNRQLDPEQLGKANRLLDEIRDQLRMLSGGDDELLFAYRRKIAKELSYDERSKPMQRRALKKRMRALQGGLCPICGGELPESYVVLDRIVAAGGYVEGNVRLLCEPCDRKVQKERRYT
jgi:hypothetical protein